MMGDDIPDPPPDESPPAVPHATRPIVMALLAALGSARPTPGDDGPKGGARPPRVPGFAEFVVVPIRVHVLTATDLPDVDCKLADADIRRVLGKVNGIWHAAGIHWGLESLVREPAASQDEFREALDAERGGTDRPPSLELLRPLAPRESRIGAGVDVYYIHRFEANGVYLGRRVAFVQETARLRPVEGGIDEPLPRVTAHELGHALGLAHRQDRVNLLASGTTGTALNEEEIERARGRALITPGARTAPDLRRDADEAEAAGDPARALLLRGWLAELPGADAGEAAP